MYVLLRQLHRLRTTVARPGPTPRGSLAVRHVDAGSCNGCEHELTAAANPYYDLQQYGLNLVASPRHADVLLVTGPVTRPG
jgi:Ni,Fe-hydrogenase III small subunit